MISVNFVLSALLDVVVLFYAGKLLAVKGNSSGKALTATAISAFSGLFIGDVLIKVIFSPLISFLLLLAPLVLIAIIFFRLFVIKFVYKISFGSAFSLWLVSAVISVVVSFWLPF